MNATCASPSPSVAAWSEHGTLPPVLSAEDEQALLQAVEKGEAGALEALLAPHLRLVRSVAGRYVRSGISTEDLLAEGTLGLLEAARRFDTSKGARFATYASWWVNARIRRFALANRRIVGAPSTREGRKVMGKLRSAQRRLTRELGRAPSTHEVATELQVGVESVRSVEAALGRSDASLEADEGAPLGLHCESPSPEDIAARRERRDRTRARLERELTNLEPRERLIVERRLLSDDAEPLTSIGATLGLSRERVRQLECRAKDKLRAAFVDVA